ncbi:MAG TPA: metal-dependent hydrolase [Nitrosomonas nitrosa]|uniref:Inner membrane protein n=1 Tax=Nitrosomonas nitrosa TaxID=52442 RepID=A0A8H8Z057_9PROT|nr:metal-dependent hydrolase [Nitrosomonas nitrosa]CAE6508880.1 Inner membrane protein [Nitrosomonas nitrosa]HBZ30270.1 metal-dependent hydrolase [Nitrosomonas nitrosa]HNP50576.1 metal-dependent hydrolase [Nitrosomonas nitrosa]
MDLLTQGLLGAGLAQAGARQHETRIATGVGFFAGLLADADILIQSSNDPLLTVEFHRHFTHSLFFVPLGALIAAAILWLFVRRRLSFSRLYLFCFLGYCLSGVLDALTSYGTHLFWPVSEGRVALNIISVIDPIFTLILLIAVIYAYKQHKTIVARMGLTIAGIYLVFGWMQLQRAEAVATTLAASRGHTIEQLIVKPTLGNLVLWRSIYETDGKFYVDAIRVGLFSEARVYAGDSITKFVPTLHLDPLPENSVLAKDIARFTVFSDGFVAIQPDQPNLLVDVRYSNLPTTVSPLWGIEMDTQNPGQHAHYRLFRDASKETRQKFLTYLMGEPIEH